MKSGTLAIIGAAVGAAGAQALKAPFPGTGDNPALDLIAYHDPRLHAAVRVWYYAWPAVAVVLAGSFTLSVWRVWFQPLAKLRRRGRLPQWPMSPTDDAPSLVVGELHHPTVPQESERPSLLVIPEKGLYTGVFVVVAVGTGKTTACMYPFAEQLLSWQADDPRRRTGGRRDRGTVVHRSALAGRRGLPALRERERPDGGKAQDHALPVPREAVCQEVQHKDRHGDGGLKGRLPGLDYRHVPADYQSQERVEHEAAP